MMVLTDEQWAVLEPLVETCRPHAKVPPSDLRRTVEAIIWRCTNGAKWRSIPLELGPWWKAAQIFIRWARLGVWDRFYRPPLGAGSRAGAGRRRPPRRGRLRAGGKRGTAAACAAERERVGAALVIGVHPIHHGMGPPARAHGRLRRAAVLGDVEQSKRPLAGAGMGCAQRQVAQ